jgi:Ca2+-binding RTX toxin-like protein
MSDPQMQAVFPTAAQEAESKVDAWLAGIAPSDERIALVSMAYNNLIGVNPGGSFKSPSLRQAIINDNRAEAWYEIRYNSNGGASQSPGIASRRITESDLFSLYDNSGQSVGEAEAKEVLRMYTTHRAEIDAYESQFSALFAVGGTTIQFQVISAITTLVDIYNAGHTIDGEVLVDTETGHILDEYGSLVLDKNDLLFGEGGNDYLYGHGGEDVLYGGAGEDRLYGGAGDDRLEGGAGFDTYRWSTGDGHDRIEDSDADGVIFVNGQMLAGGVKKVGHTDWTSPDGTIKYEMLGTDLVVKLNGTTIMTVNENFQSGQFGISLIDAPSISTAAPATTRTIVGDFQPLDIDLVEAGVQIGYDDLGNIIQDPESPGDRSDILNGSGGNDTMNGGALADRLTALGGSDILTGGSDGDVLIGQDGNDQLFAEQLVTVSSLTTFENFGGTVGTGVQGDFLTGGINDDVLVGGAGNDALYGGTGKDLVLGGAGNDVIDGDSDFVATDFGWSYTFSGPLSYTLLNAVQLSDGNVVGDDDALYGGAGNDVMFGKKGKDLLYGEAGDDTITGGDGDDVVLGGANNDVLQGDDIDTTGNDYMDGGDGDDVVLGAAGHDTVVGGGGNDILYGEAANLFGIIGDDILDGGDGDDELNGTGGSDVLFGGAGHDVLRGDFLDDTVPGDDVLYGDDGNDMLRGEAGNDSLDGGAGDDELQGNQGNDDLSGGIGVDTMFGQEGEDTLLGDAGDDFLYGDSDGLDPGIGANDVLDGGEGNDLLLGDGGDDQLFGGTGNDILLGDTDLDPQIAGADWLFGEEGDDQLHGGAGIDVLDGGTGSDIYFFNLGDGHDEIFEEDVTGDVNTIVFGPGIMSQMLTYTQNAAQGTLLIQVNGGADSILIHGFANTGVNGTGGIQNIVAGGQSFSLADLLGLPSGQIVGTAGNDVIRTGAGNDTIFAGDGNDAITANSGDDLLIGGAGYDTYIFNFGDRLDSIADTVTATEGNRILFGPGISAANLTYTLSADTLTIAYNGNADAVQLIGFNQNTVLGSLVVSTVQFDDGSAVNLADLLPPFTNNFPTVPNPIADQTAPEDVPWTFVVPANTFADEEGGGLLTYSARLADGSALPGWLSFDAGTRTFSGIPDDAEVGIIGLRVTATDTGNLSVVDTFDLTVTNVNEAPTVAVPLVNQAAAKDVLFTFVVPAGAFMDVDPGDSLAYSATLSDNSPLPAWLTFNPSTRTFSGTPQFSDVGTVNVKVVVTDTGSLSTSDEFTLTVAHGLNEITGTAASDTLTGTGGNDLIRGLGGSDALSGLDGHDTLEGGDGDDQLSGGAGNDTLDGGAGDDQLYAGAPGETGTNLNLLIGGAGSDRLEGYIGNDTFQGGPGSDVIFDSYGGQDVYLFDRGDGQDVLNPHRGTIRFAAGVLPTDVTVRGNSDLSLVLSINGTTDKMTLAGWANPFNGTQIDRVEFADGTVWNAATLQAKAATGTAGNDYLRGSIGNDVLLGLGGNDLIEALDGEDVLDGGTGNDTLRGDLGNDTYVFGRGYGVDLVQDAGGTADTIQLAPGILASDVSLLRNGNDLLLSIDQSPTHLQMSSAASIERITFNDGTIWDAAAIASHTVVGTVNAMTGTAANDTFIVDNTLDTVTEAANQGTDTIQSLVTYTLPVNVENLTLTSHFNVDGSGNLLDNVILGNSGNNKLVGSLNDYNGGGSDILQGGAGDDSYTVIGNADTVIEAPNEGNDTITLFGDANRGWNYALPDHVENLIVTIAGEVFLQDRDFFGNALDNVISGDPEWLNYIDGGLGADTMIGGRLGNTYIVDNLGDTVRDTHTGVDSGLNLDIVLSSVTFTLGSNLENLTLTGTAAINGTGNELHNVLTGNSAVNALTGGAGDDTYVIGAGDTIVELAGQGTDTVSSDQSYALSADLENLTLTGTAVIDATGNALDNVLTGNSANNVLDGGAGADQLVGDAGDDTYYVGTGDTVTEQLFGGTDTVIADQTFALSNDLENLTLMGIAVINGTGNASDNILTGNSAANVLTGGAGDDTYVVDGADSIVENDGEGTDTVQASGSWVLASNLENLTLTGAAAINGTGNTLNNVLAGNSGANILTGGVGDDTYDVGSGDTIIELANEGIDTVLSGASVTLASDLEHLTLIGTAAIDGTGNAQNNTLIGNTSANVLNGGAGADSMSGDAGDDTYVVDNVGDTVTESSSAGIDTVQSSITYTLGTNVENLTLTGATAINGTGNSLANVLTGNNTANTLAGGTGNDTYIVGAGDTVTEAASAGTDMVQSSVTFTLGSNIEHLTLTGTAAINGTGNTLNNTLIGNSANNVLSGGTGNDIMSGGSGNDTYVVNAAGDVVTELVNEGMDTVQSAVTWTLGANNENLTLTGTSALNGTGNVLDNALVGNSAANTLTGAAGNDTLDGGAGNDTMVGGAGDDTFVVNATGDVVTEQANEGTDTVLSAVPEPWARISSASR